MDGINFNQIGVSFKGSGSYVPDQILTNFLISQNLIRYITPAPLERYSNLIKIYSFQKSFLVTYISQTYIWLNMFYEFKTWSFCSWFKLSITPWFTAEWAKRRALTTDKDLLLPWPITQIPFTPSNKAPPCSAWSNLFSVSYTHLTLPTNREV